MIPVEELEEIVEWKHLTTWQKAGVFIIPTLLGLIAGAVATVCILFQ